MTRRKSRSRLCLRFTLNLLSLLWYLGPNIPRKGFYKIETSSICLNSVYWPKYHFLNRNLNLNNLKVQTLMSRPVKQTKARYMWPNGTIAGGPKSHSTAEAGLYKRDICYHRFSNILGHKSCFVAIRLTKSTAAHSIALMAGIILVVQIECCRLSGPQVPDSGPPTTLSRHSQREI